jgi:hypothetical protein
MATNREKGGKHLIPQWLQRKEGIETNINPQVAKSMEEE